MDERDLNKMDNGYENMPTANGAQDMNVRDISSSSGQFQYNGSVPSQPYSMPENYVQQPSEYDRYVSQFNTPQIYPVQNADYAKKTGKGKKIALIACSLALALCLGIGGGIFGTYIVNGNSITASNVSSSKSNGGSSDLKIVQSSNTNKGTTAIENVVSKVKDSVVEITTESTSYDAFYGQYVSQGAGSGVIISADGYIITNNHVIDGAQTVTVKTTDGKSYKANVIGKDSVYDVALLKIDASNLTVASFGDSDKLNVGETAIAIGNPLGALGGTVTSGIVSALNREIKIDGKTMELLQTDAAVNPGNSGGGLFDANGDLIGIVVAKSTSTSSGAAVEGLGFAIPINNVKGIIDDLKENGKVTGRAALDVTLVDIDSESKMVQYNVNEQGVYIASIEENGAAKRAGLKVGDRITKLGDTEIKSVSSLRAALMEYKAGDKADITVSRDGSEQKISVTFSESSSDSESSNSNNFNADGNYRYYDGDIYDFFN